MTTAFVLSGGASLGAMQVGMLQALAERGVEPDLVLGASAGAVNATWIAGHPHLGQLDELAAIWSGLRTREIFPFRPLRGFLGFIGRRDSLLTLDRLRSLVGRYLTFERLEDAPVPVRIVTTEVRTGHEIVLTRGDTLDAVLASASIPGVFPPVRVEGRDLMDGGVADNTPISHAVELGVETIYVLPTGYACALERTPTSAIGMAVQAVTLLVQQRLVSEVELYEGHVDLRVIPPLCPLTVSPADFSHGAWLIAQARARAAEWLDGPWTDPRASLRAAHAHDRPDAPT
ncbi:MAG TPA: patatin-like phospholipase family protein [Acidimicrobiia bacterium]